MKWDRFTLEISLIELIFHTQTGMIETNDFQRHVSDLIRLPIGPILPPILADKQIVWLRKEIAQLARHRQMVNYLLLFKVDWW